MNIKEKKLRIKNLKAFYMDDWELTEEQKDQLDALATDILNVGIEQGKLKSSANQEGYKLVPICKHEWSIQRSGRYICDLCGEFNEFMKP